MAATRSDYAYYSKLWEKAFLLEIVRRDNGAVKKSFAFSMPPESVKIDLPQRINVTKTFGGVFIDDYGVDVAQISISGSTGNGQIKEVFSDGSSAYMDGKNEAFYILKEILQYKRRLDDYDQYDLLLYDLSSVDAYVISENSRISVNVDGWKVVLRDGGMARSKEKPLFFNYTLNFIGIEQIGQKQLRSSSAYEPPAIESILAIVDILRAGSVALKKALASYKSILDKIAYVDDLTNMVESELRTYYNAISGVISSTIDGINSVFDIIAFPMDVVSDLFKGVIDVRTEFENIWPTIESGFNNLETKAEQVQSLWNSMFGLEQAAANMRATAKSAGATPKAELIPLSNLAGAVASATVSGVGVSLLLTYGYSEVVATSETRLDRLSSEAYGSPDYADTIAAYNNIQGDSDITPGMIIKIPYLSYTTDLQESQIYAIGSETYGTDIALDSDGDVVLSEYGDYAIVSGMDNIGQAIDMRLAEDRGGRIRLDAYGIKKLAGSVDALGLMVFLSSIKDTLVKDHRIIDAYNFVITQDGDKTILTYDIELVSGVQFSYNTVL